jgi:acyl carrier protein
MGLPLKKQSSLPYPKRRVQQAIRDSWTREQEELQRIADPVDELQPNRGTVFDLVPVISSHHAVEIVLDLEDVLGYEVPDSVIKRGGYHSCDEMVEHLDGKLAALHFEQYPT